MFIFKFFKIFFRNKWSEIKDVLPEWRTVGILSLVLVVICVTIVSVMAICYGIGYVAIEYVGIEFILHNSNGDIYDAYLVCGFVLLVLGIICATIIYLIGKFPKWIWTNIKMAIAEAKEL